MTEFETTRRIVGIITATVLIGAPLVALVAVLLFLSQLGGML